MDTNAYPRTKTDPWSHQQEAWSLIRPLDAFLIAHDMGAGKTKLAIDTCNGFGSQKVLVLCPKTILDDPDVWPGQFKLHSHTAYSVLPLNKKNYTAKKKAAQLERFLQAMEITGLPHVVIVNYESAWRSPLGPIYDKRNRMIDPGLLLSTPWDMAILDESHRTKAPGGRASWFTKRLGKVAKKKLCLSGTPMPHSPLDIYAQFRFLDDRVFGTSYTVFKRRYAQMGGYEAKQVIGFQNLEELQRKIFTMAHRVRKEDVLDLPPVMHQRLTCELEPKAQKVYDQMHSLFVAQVEAGEVTAANALVKLLRLQQITGGSIKTDGGDVQRVSTAKQSMLEDLLTDLDPKEPVVVFCRFHEDMNAVYDACMKVGRGRPLELSGRKKELAEWKEGKCSTVLVAQIRAGGIGIDLTRARYCVYYSQGFSLGDFEQSLSRPHRPGQTRAVTYYHLVARKTVDVAVYNALSQKKKVVDYVMEVIK